MAIFRTFLRLAAAAALGMFPYISNAQTGSGRPIRTVLALGRVASVVDKPLDLRLSRVSISAGTTADYIGDPSAIYILSGTVALVGSERRSLQEGDAVFVPFNSTTKLQAGPNASAEILQYQLTAPGVSSTIAAPAVTTELKRMEIPGHILQAGPYEFSLTRVTLSPGGTGPTPHTRSTAALYYVIGGGTITFWPAATINGLSGESRTEARPAGSTQAEPFGFIHTWAPTSDSPLILLQANISQEGAPEIMPVK
jgi:quercetin dioxygenase-like cupin family protein